MDMLGKYGILVTISINEKGEIMKKQEWVEQFERKNGRKPSPEEYFAAKNAGEFVEEVAGQAGLNGTVHPSQVSMPNVANATISPVPPKRKFHLAYLLLLIPVLGLVFYLGSQFGPTKTKEKSAKTAVSTTTTTSSSTTTSSEQTEVRLSDYEISFHAEGENGSGVPVVQIDSYPYVAEEADFFLENPIISYSKASGLSNGDKVLVELHLDAARAEELGLVVKGDFAKYFTVSGLEDVYVESPEVIAERAVENYRQAINQALSTRDGSVLLGQFTSSTNSYYREIKDYAENGAITDNVVGYEYDSTHISNVTESGDTISFQLEFRAKTVYSDGRRSSVNTNVRHCVLKKVDGEYRFDVYE